MALIKRILSSPAFKRQYTSLLIAHLVTTLLFLSLIYSIQIIHFNKELENLYALSYRMRNNDAIEDVNLIETILNEPTVLEIEEGKKILSIYGYDSKISYIKKRTLENLPQLIIGYISALIVSAVITFIVNTKRQSALFIQFESISSIISDILNGDYCISDEKHNEGIISRLHSDLNKMIKMIKASNENLSNDKVFFKNILSDISHQLKTPLSSLIMFNDLLINEPEMDKDQRDNFIVQSQQELLRMQWLIKSILQLAKLETGTIEYNFCNNNIVEPIEYAIEVLKPIFPQKKIIVNNYLSKNILVKIDINWLSEAIINVIKNALQHSANINGEVTVELKLTPLYIQVSVIDNGIGISKNDLPRIFERFYKGQSNANMSSVGIGLSLSKMIIEDHDGSISVKTDRSKGSEFIISLPY